METNSKLWDLNYEVESLEKENFLYYQDALKLHLKEKGEGIHESNYLIYSKEVMHQNRVFIPIFSHTYTIQLS